MITKFKTKLVEKVRKANGERRPEKGKRRRETDRRSGPCGSPMSGPAEGEIRGSGELRIAKIGRFLTLTHSFWREEVHRDGKKV